MTAEYFAEMLSAQEGCCAICGTDINEQSHADHDHRTKQSRGILCGSCNMALGLLGDDVERLRMAAEYIESYA